MKPNYIECPNCISWNNERRISQLCTRCNNSTLTISPKELLCNMCGNSMAIITGCPADNDICGLYNASVRGCYNSFHLFDMTTYTFSFCEQCLRTIFNQCKIKPNVEDDMD